jgi:DNA repair protein RecN (Recombination protein N)
LQTAQSQLQELRADIERNSQQQDFLQFQYEELASAHLAEGEQEELEQLNETMEHAEDIKTALYEADNALNGQESGSQESGAISQMRTAIQALDGIRQVLPASAELAERIESCRIELRDVADEVSSLLENTDFDPSELDRVQNRLDKLYELEKKYHAETIGELIALHDDLAPPGQPVFEDDIDIAGIHRQEEPHHQEPQRQAGSQQPGHAVPDQPSQILHP